MQLLWRRMEIELRVRKLKNGKDEIRGEMIKGGGKRVLDWILRLCNMAFESGGVLEDWRAAVIIPLYKGKKRGQNICREPSRQSS